MRTIVRFIYNRLLRILQEQEAVCEKIGDDLENVAYKCKVEGDVSTVNSITIEPIFNFTAQDIKIIGISPIAHTFMENIQNATGEDDDLLQSNIFILDHSNITTNTRYNIFNISGIINDQKPKVRSNFFHQGSVKQKKLTLEDKLKRKTNNNNNFFYKTKNNV